MIECYDDLSQLSTAMRNAGQSIEESQDKLDDKVYEAQEAAILTEYHLVLQKILSRTQDRARDIAVR